MFVLITGANEPRLFSMSNATESYLRMKNSLHRFENKRNSCRHSQVIFLSSPHQQNGTSQFSISDVNGRQAEVERKSKENCQNDLAAKADTKYLQHF